MIGEIVMNNKGQALVEFVLILPLFILMLFAVIDFGMIYNTKNELESDSVDIVNLYNNDIDINTIKTKYNDIDISVSSDDKYTTININKSIDIITPGLNRILGDKYKVEVERVIYND